METLKKKEKEETAALENMVHMVEKNLKISTVQIIHLMYLISHEKIFC